ncbi:hypothetical protein ABB37_06600 [Leptomonas pyrrhocoris]|uniref:Uncharacterized protein n=1 Tax=Leptomonas pyrrhocoris TaxID=157538 RepID=A0A0N0DTN8_LEPPY|nr:hypothetical protein ABB37_06600 [Leptomonas pyrrhocoris]XP_015656201.1 hypothetical protein ABB37_06600 [Leptomonas pyrrhocoris]KPA77761.1 hypothetical protein ABB37_06600 [Leptomonas pyrrhocoris]KPA77762.1 hypothetical protein ABB37_06600 [Leptomonas pyrrhocoris]|eukprot:XP_015656200.1 hypothetical protein ABB37_06600 [Leptomonas pyrrhocoris]
MTSSIPSRWESVSRQHERIRLSIDNRLRKIDAELKELDALREGLTRPEGGSMQTPRTVVVPPTSSTSALSDRRKRNREDTAVTVGYLRVHGVQRRMARGRGADPFEDAGLYAEEGNPVAQFAPVQLSSDEVARQQLLTLFPAIPVTGLRKTDQLPPVAVSRIESRMKAAGLPKASFSIGRRIVSDAYVSVSPLTSSDEYIMLLKDMLSPTRDAQLAQALCRELCADPTAVRSSLCAILAERAVADTLPARARVLAVKLLGLRQFSKSSVDTVAWTFIQCCQCTDRDVMESSQVQWAQTLRCATPRELPPFPLRDSVLYLALCHTLLNRLAAARTARQGYLPYVLTAAGGYAQLISSKALLSQRRFEDFTAHVSTAFEGSVGLLS